MAVDAHIAGLCCPLPTHRSLALLSAVASLQTALQVQLCNVLDQYCQLCNDTEIWSMAARGTEGHKRCSNFTQSPMQPANAPEIEHKSRARTWPGQGQSRVGAKNSQGTAMAGQGHGQKRPGNPNGPTIMLALWLR